MHGPQYIYIYIYIYIYKEKETRDPRGTNPGCQLATATNFVRWHLNVWVLTFNLLHVTLLTPRSLRCRLDLWNICAHLG